MGRPILIIANIAIAAIIMTGCQTLFEKRGISKDDEKALFHAIERDDTEFILAFLEEHGDFPDKVFYLLDPKMSAVVTAARYRNLRLLGEYWSLELTPAIKQQAILGALPLSGIATNDVAKKEKAKFGTCEEHHRVVKWLYDHGARLRAPEDKNVKVDWKRGKALRENTSNLCLPILKTIVDHEPLAAKSYLNAWNLKILEMIEKDEDKKTNLTDSFWRTDNYQAMKEKLDYFADVAEGTQPGNRYKYLMSKLEPIYARVAQRNEEVAAKQKERSRYLYNSPEGWTERGCAIVQEINAYQNSINYLKEKSKRSGVIMGSDAESLDNYATMVMHNEQRLNGFKVEFRKKWGKEMDVDNCTKHVH